MPPQKTKKSEKIKKVPVKTFNEKLHDWFENDEVQNHQDEIIASIKDKDKPFSELNYEDTSIIFWSSRLNYKKFLKEALKWSDDSQEVIDSIHDNETALSISAYYGYHEIVALLLNSDALIKVKKDDSCINAYKSLGRGFYKWPTDIEDYKKAFKAILLKDSDKPNRTFFSDRYNSTNNKAYLACLHLYDHVHSRKKDRNQKSYREREILTVEDTATRRFFRFSKDMQKDGAAKTLAAELFKPQATVDIKNYSARSFIIALVDKMRCTSEEAVQAAVDTEYMSPEKNIFSINFTLGTTKFLYEWRPAKWQRGNCVLKINGQGPKPFGDFIAGKLEQLTKTQTNHGINDRTQKLGELFLKKTKKLQPFYSAEFIYTNNRLLIRTLDDDDKLVATYPQAKATIHELNGLLILWSIVEPARRLSGHTAASAKEIEENEKKSRWDIDFEVIKQKKAFNIDHIPVATMQIRALQLLSQGLIALRDIFGVSEKYNSHCNYRAEYGVSTGQDLIGQFSIVQEKSTQLASIGLPRPALASKASFFSRNYTKQLLREGYGSADESDDEDYSDVDLPDNPFIKLSK